MNHVLRQMYWQESGSIVNTASQVAHRPSVDGSDYSLQKSAVLMLIKVAALEADGTGGCELWNTQSYSFRHSLAPVEWTLTNQHPIREDI